MPSETDQFLLQLVRAGRHDAYGILWERHVEAIRRAVRFYTDFDPDDVAAETFLRVLRAIQRGGGPVDTFRPYAMTAARNIAAEWARSRRDISLEIVGDIEDDSFESSMGERADERLLAALAFDSLPARWKEVLQYSEVEGMQPAEIAPILNMSPNSVAVLAVRAREGLRQAWILAHANIADSDTEHGRFLLQTPKFLRGKLKGKAELRFRNHIAVCAYCSGSFEAMRQASAQLNPPTTRSSNAREYLTDPFGNLRAAAWAA